MRASGPCTDSPAGSPPAGPAGTRPRVVLSPTSPHTDAGMRIEPPPSVPCATGRMPAATAAAAPPDDPPADRVVSHGVTAGGAPAGSV